MHKLRRVLFNTQAGYAITLLRITTGLTLPPTARRNCLAGLVATGWRAPGNGWPRSVWSRAC